MTTRERIFVLADNGVEAHIIAALLNLEVGDVVLTLADPTHEPSPSGGGPERLTEGNGPPTEGTHPVGWLYFDREQGTLYVSIEPPSWEERLRFRAGAVVGVEGIAYKSLVGDNLGVEPPSTPGDWEPLDHYSQWDCLGGQARYYAEGLKRDGSGQALGDDREIGLYAGPRSYFELSDFSFPRANISLDGENWLWFGPDAGARAGGMEFPGGTLLFNTNVEPEEAQGEDGDFALGRDGNLYAKRAGVWAVAWPELGVIHELPAGGTTGEVLAKKTDADFDAEWIAVGVIPSQWTINAHGEVVIAPDQTGEGHRLVTVKGPGDTEEWSGAYLLIEEHDGTPVLTVRPTSPGAGHNQVLVDARLAVIGHQFSVQQDGEGEGGLYVLTVDAEHGLISWAGEDGQVWGVTADGYEMAKSRARPPEEDIAPGQVLSYYDATNGDAKFVRLGRTHDGTLVEAVSKLT